MTFVHREPPDAFAFPGAKRTRIDFWWRYLCPACCAATVALIPSGRGGWRIASEIGCSRGCAPAAIDAWQAWRCGEGLPAAELDDRARRYAMGAVRRVLDEIPAQPTLTQLIKAAFRCGQLVEAADIDARAVAGALWRAAARAGLTDAEKLATALTAGRAKPARLP